MCHLFLPRKKRNQNNIIITMRNVLLPISSATKFIWHMKTLQRATGPRQNQNCFITRLVCQNEPPRGKSDKMNICINSVPSSIAISLNTERQKGLTHTHTHTMTDLQSLQGVLLEIIDWFHLLKTCRAAKCWMANWILNILSMWQLIFRFPLISLPSSSVVFVLITGAAGEDSADWSFDWLRRPALFNYRSNLIPETNNKAVIQ